MTRKNLIKIVLALSALLLVGLIVRLHHGALASPDVSRALGSAELLPAPAPGAELARQLARRVRE
jgi:hypothetical protein